MKMMSRSCSKKRLENYTAQPRHRYTHNPKYSFNARVLSDRAPTSGNQRRI